jgi:hypothetical protein
MVVDSLNNGAPGLSTISRFLSNSFQFSGSAPIILQSPALLVQGLLGT